MSKLVSNAKNFSWYYLIPETMCLFSLIKLELFEFLPVFNCIVCFGENGTITEEGEGFVFLKTLNLK